MKKTQTISLAIVGGLYLLGCAGDDARVEEALEPTKAIEESADPTPQYDPYDDEASPSSYASAPQTNEPVSYEEVAAAADEKLVAGKLTYSDGSTDPLASAPSEAKAEPKTKKAKKTLAPAVGTTRSHVQCSRASDDRNIKVIDKKAGGCGVNYEKPGSHRQVGWANHDMSFCDKTSDKIKGNLSSAGFSCSELESFAAETSTPEVPAGSQ